ncbi:hypothetical protein R3I93_007291 [Phoxinus phoxinus]|uniref:Uncharacterized protein n=1 Tax=Phoxinus phoxinus TaxID=58324 RepID=A0AAN9DDD4_9TELE
MPTRSGCAPGFPENYISLNPPFTGSICKLCIVPVREDGKSSPPCRDAGWTFLHMCHYDSDRHRALKVRKQK